MDGWKMIHVLKKMVPFQGRPSWTIFGDEVSEPMATPQRLSTLSLLDANISFHAPPTSKKALMCAYYPKLLEIHPIVFGGKYPPSKTQMASFAGAFPIVIVVVNQSFTHLFHALLQSKPISKIHLLATQTAKWPVTLGDDVTSRSSLKEPKLLPFQPLICKKYPGY